MKRLAIFVEGLTEQLFVNKLVTEIAGTIDIEVVEHTVRDHKGKNAIQKLVASSLSSDKKFYILIVDCCGESKVRSEIDDHYDNLAKKGYSKILGLRDVFPLDASKIPVLVRAVKYKLRTEPVPTAIVLAIMEVESWFLAEHSHLERIHPALTVQRVHTELGIDLETHDVESIPNPADTLDSIYKLVGRRYIKDTSRLSRTINKLDFANVYFNLPEKVSSLNELIEHIDEFFTEE